MQVCVLFCYHGCALKWKDESGEQKEMMSIKPLRGCEMEGSKDCFLLEGDEGAWKRNCLFHLLPDIINSNTPPLVRTFHPHRPPHQPIARPTKSNTTHRSRHSAFLTSVPYTQGTVNAPLCEKG